MSGSDSNFRVKRSKRVPKKRSKDITPKGKKPNQAGSVTNIVKKTKLHHWMETSVF